MSYIHQSVPCHFGSIHHLMPQWVRLSLRTAAFWYWSSFWAAWIWLVGGLSAEVAANIARYRFVCVEWSTTARVFRRGYISAWRMCWAYRYWGAPTIGTWRWTTSRRKQRFLRVQPFITKYYDSDIKQHHTSRLNCPPLSWYSTRCGTCPRTPCSSRGAQMACCPGPPLWPSHPRFHSTAT